LDRCDRDSIITHEVGVDAEGGPPSEGFSAIDATRVSTRDVDGGDGPLGVGSVDIDLSIAIVECGDSGFIAPQVAVDTKTIDGLTEFIDFDGFDTSVTTVITSRQQSRIST